MNLTFHHLGFACRSMASDENSWLGLGYQREGDEFTDPTQGIRGLFLTGAGPRIELVEALPDSNVLEPWLKGGSRLYHQAFLTPDIEKAIDEMEEQRARVTVPPVPAVAFDDRRIAFLMLRNLSLIELIEE